MWREGPSPVGVFVQHCEEYFLLMVCKQISHKCSQDSISSFYFDPIFFFFGRHPAISLKRYSVLFTRLIVHRLTDGRADFRFLSQGAS